MGNYTKLKKLRQFQRYCDKWLKKFDLDNREVVYKLECPDDADATCNVVRGKIILCLNADTRRNIDMNRLALHEVLHALLWPLDGEINKEHDIIEILSDVLIR